MAKKETTKKPAPKTAPKKEAPKKQSGITLAELKKANKYHFAESNEFRGVEKSEIKSARGKKYLVETGEKFGRFMIYEIVQGSTLSAPISFKTLGALKTFLEG